MNTLLLYVFYYFIFHRFQIDYNKRVILKTNHDYYYQIQTQLRITNITKCCFFIFTNYWYYNIVISYDVNFWNPKIQSLLDM